MGFPAPHFTTSALTFTFQCLKFSKVPKAELQVCTGATHLQGAVSFRWGRRVRDSCSCRDTNTTLGLRQKSFLVQQVGQEEAMPELLSFLAEFLSPGLSWWGRLTPGIHSSPLLDILPIWKPYLSLICSAGLFLPQMRIHVVFNHPLHLPGSPHYIL